MRASVVLLFALSLPAAVFPVAASHAAPPAKRVFEYSFDGYGSGVVSDLTGKGHALTLEGEWSGASGKRTPAVSFDIPSYGSSADRSDLNPGTSEFAVTAVFKVGKNLAGLGDTPNIAQKGFYNDPGQWKLQLRPKTGGVQCRFKGAGGAELVTSSVTGVDNGQWHTATCWRSGSQLGVTVDGVVSQVAGQVGAISSTRPLRVGGKSFNATSDQFIGTLDYLCFAVGAKAESVSRAGAPS